MSSRDPLARLKKLPQNHFSMHFWTILHCAATLKNKCLRHHEGGKQACALKQFSVNWSSPRDWEQLQFGIVRRLWYQAPVRLPTKKMNHVQCLPCRLRKVRSLIYCNCRYNKRQLTEEEESCASKCPHRHSLLCCWVLGRGNISVFWLRRTG